MIPIKLYISFNKFVHALCATSFATVICVGRESEGMFRQDLF